MNMFDRDDVVDMVLLIVAVAVGVVVAMVPWIAMH